MHADRWCVTSQAVELDICMYHTAVCMYAVYALVNKLLSLLSTLLFTTALLSVIHISTRIYRIYLHELSTSHTQRHWWMKMYPMQRYSSSICLSSQTSPYPSTLISLSLLTHSHSSLDAILDYHSAQHSIHMMTELCMCVVDVNTVTINIHSSVCLLSLYSLR